MAATEYVVLVRLVAEDTWRVLDKTVRAHSADAACRAQNVAGVYAAVPARSWRPWTVVVEHVPRVTVKATT